MNCPNCGVEITNGDEICNSCGTHVKYTENSEQGKKKLCSNCGMEFGSDDIFCGHCGARLNEFIVKGEDEPAQGEDEPAQEEIEPAQGEQEEREKKVLKEAERKEQEQQGARQREEPVKKPFVIVIAAIVSIMMGIIMITAIGPIVETELSYIIGGFATVIGGITIVVGVLDIAAAYGLWKLKKWGGILGVILSIIGLLLSIPFMAIDYGLSVILSFEMIILIALGWKSLK